MDGLVIVGTLVLIASLVPIQRLIDKLPPGQVRRNWRILRALIFFFIAGYIWYTAGNWHNGGRSWEFIVAAIFCLGACFVFLVNTLSLQTTIDVRRVAAMELENITDPLMGINNRRYLDRRLKEEVERALRYNLPLSILLLDIDRFKRINDRYGHQVGDLVLKSLGKLIVSTVRTTDVVARYGGEEILIIATCTPVPPTPVFAERLRAAVENSVLVPQCALTQGEQVRVTVSVGVAFLGPGTADMAALVKSADDALYRAKREGRNRVVIDEGPTVA